jgi:hypothetical protein
MTLCETLGVTGRFRAKSADRSGAFQKGKP